MRYCFSDHFIRFLLSFLISILPAMGQGTGLVSSSGVPLRLGSGSEIAGNLFFQETDLALLPSMETGPYLLRAYNSRGSGRGIFGERWTCDPVDIRFESSGIDTVTVFTGEGREVEFRKSNDAEYLPVGAADLQDSRMFESEGRFYLLLPSGDQWIFNLEGYLVSRQDSLGNEIVISRESNGITPVYIQGPYGRKIDLSVRDGRIVAAEGPTGLRYIYTYDNRERLTTAIDPLGLRTAYTYGTDNLMQSHIRSGAIPLRFSYDNGLLSTLQEGEDASYFFSYKALPGSLNSGYIQETRDFTGTVIRTLEIRNSGRNIAETGPLGNRTEFRYDEKHRLIGRLGPTGMEERWHYDSSGTLQAYDDARGNRTAYSWVVPGEKLVVTSPRGAKTTLEYDLQGFLLRETGSTGVVVEYARDDRSRLVNITVNDRSVWTCTYDEFGREASIMSDSGSWRYEYDQTGNVIGETDGAGRKSVFRYDLVGRLLTADDGEGRITRWNYDEFGRLISMSDGEGNLVRLWRTPDGRLEQLTDAGNNTYGFRYDRGRLSGLIFPDDTEEASLLDSFDRVIEETDRKGDTISYRYDRFGRVVEQSYKDGFIAWKYNDFGDIVEIHDRNGTTLRKYNLFGDLEEVLDAAGRKLKYYYDHLGRRITRVDDDGKITSYAYDGMGNISKIIGPEGEEYIFSYDQAGREQRREYPTGLTTFMAYDDSGFLVSMATNNRSGDTIDRLDIDRDRSGRIVSVTGTDGSKRYEYDLAGRLVKFEGSDNYRESIAYDAAGNRIFRSINGRQQYYSHIDQNRLTNDGQTSYSYDADGNLSGRSDGTVYNYDGLGRLVSVTTADGVAIQYTYDSAGRLVKRQHRAGRDEYLYDSEDVVAVYNGDISTPSARYVQGPGLDDPLALWKNGRLYTYLRGINGNIRALMNDQGETVESYDYSPFGELLSGNASMNNILFQGRMWDKQTGLYYFRARFYDPKLGRFTSMDPIRFHGGFHLYSFAENDPVNRTDPLGLITGMLNKLVKENRSAGITFSGQITPAEFLGIKYPTPGLKFGFNYQYFGEGDPRNGWYMVGGGTVGSGSSFGVTANVAADTSGNPATPWEGGFNSIDYFGKGKENPKAWKDVMGIGPISGWAPFWTADRPWAPKKGWAGFEANIFSIGTRPHKDFQGNRGGYFSQTYYKKISGNNKPFEAIAQEVLPPSVNLPIGSNQAFKFMITFVNPNVKQGTKSFDATSFSKWRYISWDSNDHSSKPCNDITQCNKNIFICKNKGSFSIVANYHNQHLKDPTGGITSAAGGSASITCGGSGGSTKSDSKDTLQFSTGGYQVEEDSGPAEITVTRMGKGSGDVSVLYRTQNGTAGSPDDYDAASGVLLWPDKDLSSKKFYVFVKKDLKMEPDETVSLQISDPTGNARLGTPSAATLTIKDSRNAAIHIAKTTNTGATVFTLGDTIRYIYNVTVPQPAGNVPLSLINVTDNNCSGVTYYSGDSDGNKQLDLKETWIYYCDLTPSATGFISNTASAGGSDPGGKRVHATASLTVEVRKGQLTVPDVRGYNLSAATYDLQEAKLTVGTVLYEKNDAPVGEVFDQSPLPGLPANPGDPVKLWISQDEPRYIFVDPPRTTVKVDEEVVFQAFLVTKDSEVIELDPRDVQWTPGPRNTFHSAEAGQYTVSANARGVTGSATVIVEEDEKTEWEPPISHSDELSKKALPPPPDAFTWYALCNKSSGDVVYGEHLDVAKYDVLGGPFQGPRDTKLWIDQNIPSWRCPMSAGSSGQWKVLCSNSNQSITLGKEANAASHSIMAGGFQGEPEARAWVNSNCPSWLCEPGGACSSGPRRGGDWTVVCSKDHGGIGLTKDPDPISHWIFQDNLFEEKDARLWTNVHCPSWRCNAEGACMPGQRVERDRPLELPPDFDGGGAIGGSDADREAERRREQEKDDDRGYDFGRRIGEMLGQVAAEVLTDNTEPTYDEGVDWEPDPPASTADCSALREQYQRKADEQTERAKKLNCEKNGYSGCAMDVVGPFFPHWPDRIFSDEACKNQQWISCIQGPFSGYLGCLDSCNSAFRGGSGGGLPGLQSCGRNCQSQMDSATERCQQQ